ncbi:hypothetical protein BJV74DRAFT_799690 [Russula compacta]|nr:hypothetical protein BJV74DRAFT_799690 [Russula compacta]
MPTPEPHCPLWCWQVCECVQVKVGADGQVEFILGSFGHALFNPEGKGGKRAWAGRWGQAGVCRRWWAEAWVGEWEHEYGQQRKQMQGGQGAGECAQAGGGRHVQVEASGHRHGQENPAAKFILGSFGKACIFNPGQAREALGERLEMSTDPSACSMKQNNQVTEEKEKGPPWFELADLYNDAKGSGWLNEPTSHCPSPTTPVFNAAASIPLSHIDFRT